MRSLQRALHLMEAASLGSASGRRNGRSVVCGGEGAHWQWGSKENCAGGEKHPGSFVLRADIAICRGSIVSAERLRENAAARGSDETERSRVSLAVLPKRATWKLLESVEGSPKSS